jgi:proteasome lid subunit RPN8/RPN11
MTTEDPQAPPAPPAAAAAGPDAAAILASSWPMRPLRAVKGARLPQYQAVVRSVALDAIHGHGKSITAVEVCGVLVGNVYRDQHGPYLYIAGAIRGDRASGLAAQVTFTAETWSEIQAVMDRDHPDERIVGWYHTHPGFGVFLSGMDLFIQDHFFNLPWQVALVYDPIGGDEGMFFWREGKADRQAFLIEEEDTRAHAPSMAETEAAEHLERNKRDLDQHAKSAVHIPDETAAPNRWDGTERRRRQRGRLVPAWVIGAIAFAISFGCTLWAMFSIQSQVVTVPHHVDHSETPQPLPAQGEK